MLKRLCIVFFGFSLVLSFRAAGQDVTPPAPVIIDSVSVLNAAGDVRIKWSASTSVDCEGYYVYRNQGGLWIQIAKVVAPATTTVTTPTQANSQPEEYRVAAYDGATPNPNVSSLCAKHNTIFLKATFDSCRAVTRLDWNPYINWTSNTYQYKVMASLNGGPFVTLAAVPGSQTSYSHQPVQANQTYTYLIRAISGSGMQSSTSNRVDQFTKMPPPPTVMNADFCSVLDEGRVALGFTIDPGAAVIQYRLMRATSKLGPFEEVAGAFPWNAIGNQLFFVDNVPTRNNFFYWKLVAVNTCNVDISESNLAGNMNVYVEALPSLINVVRWTNYEDWRVGIYYYDVYRIIDGTDTAKVAEVLYGDTIFRDNIEKYMLRVNNLDPNGRNSYYLQPQIQGNFCYFVVAHEGPGNPFGIASSSKSNTTCAVQYPRVFVPTVFTPNNDGINDIFQPFVTFGSVQDYVFTVFDRWGHPLFQTHNTHEGWDGNMGGGQNAPSGTYVYQIEFTGSDGVKFSDTKPFTLLVIPPFSSY